jgi:hypothetical protein
MPTRKYEVWLVDAGSQWSVLDKYELKDFEHGTALKVMYLTDVSLRVCGCLISLIFVNSIPYSKHLHRSFKGQRG